MIADFAIPITSGLTPQPGGHLSKDRAAHLAKQLDALHAARQAAWVAIRNYPIKTGRDQ